MTGQIVIIETSVSTTRIGKPAEIVRSTSLDGRIVFERTGVLDKMTIDGREVGVCCYMDSDAEVISTEHQAIRKQFLSALFAAEKRMPPNIEWTERVDRETAAHDEKMRKITEERAAADEARTIAVEQFYVAVPDPAIKELRELNRRLAAHWKGINEGGEGYVEQVGWSDPKGRDILLRHGLGDIVVPDGL